MQLSPHTTEPISGFYRLPSVLEIIPVCRSAWYAGVKSGRYPAGIKIARNTTVWRKADIQDLCVRLENGGI